MKSLVLFVITLFVIKAQDLDSLNSHYNENEKGYIRLSGGIFPYVGLEGEIWLGKNFTFYSNVCREFGLLISQSLSSDIVRIRMFGVNSLLLGGRYYYNLSRRMRLGKYVKNYSGNFIGINLYIPLNKFNLNAIDTLELSSAFVRAYFLSMVYGFQRAIGKSKMWGFRLEFQGGVAVAAPDGKPDFGVVRFGVIPRITIFKNIFKLSYIR